jgi:formylmethanofuran dehydrogenase subunit B
MRQLAVSQASGAISTTFAEVANRADVVLLVGCDPARGQPRFFERLLRNRTPLYRAAAPWVAYLGGAETVSGDPAVAERFIVEPARLLDALAALAVALRGRTPRAGALPGEVVDAVAAVAGRLAAAHYGVLVWEAATLGEHADIMIGLLLDIMRLLNLRTRCAGLPLGGDDNAVGAAQVMLWQTGWPLRVSFAGGVPEHDPWRWNAERMVASGEADALLWVSSGAAPPPQAPMPTVAVVAGDVDLATEPRVTIRIGIPGFDHPGTAVRADGVIALPLGAVRATPLPSAAAALGAILAKIEARAP